MISLSPAVTDVSCCIAIKLLDATRCQGPATTIDTTSPQASEPARVYPSPDAPDRWVVEAPQAASEAIRSPVEFSGPNAQNLALRYAYEAFGGARFFPL